MEARGIMKSCNLYQKFIAAALAMVMLMASGCGSTAAQTAKSSEAAGKRISKDDTDIQTETLSDTGAAEQDEDHFSIEINGTKMTAAFEQNSSADALRKLLAGGPVTVDLHDYGNFEKVGDLGISLPTNDQKITTSPGDIILYQGNQITIYYDQNTWNFTKLGEIEGLTQEELKEILGDGNVTAVFSLEQGE